MHELATWIFDNLNYWTVTLGMALESSVIPFPSELVVTPAAYHAASGQLNVFLVVLFATLGADIGAIINYVASYYLGRPIVYAFANSKFGHACMLNEEKVKKSEDYFNEHGVLATLTGRLVPVIRQLISVPAGLSKMNFFVFLGYTTLGAGIWNCVLAALGWWMHSFIPEDQLVEAIGKYDHQLKIAIVGIIALVALYFIAKKFVFKKKDNSNNK
ncbi:MAG: DedA family protein [Bacteroidaceae bacterium]|nr:DedA family protein [Bacteroidaceae bacterium]